jgi:hypothetical protein
MSVNGGSQSRGLGGRGLAALALVALVLATGCKTVREELQPVRETTLTVARSSGQVTLSWIGVQGMYYSVMYADARGAKARWKFLPDATNIRALVSGEPIVVQDRLAAAQPRYYRLAQDVKPFAP